MYIWHMYGLFLSRKMSQNEKVKTKNMREKKTPLASSYCALFVGDTLRHSLRRFVGKVQQSVLVKTGDHRVGVPVQSDGPKRYR